MKRLYLRPKIPRKGLGEQMLGQSSLSLKQIGYSRMRLDTLPGSEWTRLLPVRSIGFTEIAPVLRQSSADVLIWVGTSREVARDSTSLAASLQLCHIHFAIKKIGESTQCEEFKRKLLRSRRNASAGRKEIVLH